MLALEVKGWVVGLRARATAVEIHCGEDLLLTTPVDISRDDVERDHPDAVQGPQNGFFATIGGLRLPPQFSLDVVARLDHGAGEKLATIRGGRESLAREGALRPAFTSTPTGRTGTTWTVQLLRQHPDAVAHPPFGVEPRVASYWLEAAGSLAEPGSYKRMLRTSIDRERWWLGEWPEAGRQPIQDKALEAYLGRERTRSLAAWAHSQVEDFYRRVAEDQGKADATTFIEKAPMGLRRLKILTDLFPGAREVVLVRDPRDTVCSILSYREQNPNAALVSQDLGTHDAYLEEVAQSFRGLLEQSTRRDEALVVRYEDLIFKPERELRRILRHLELDASPETAARMLADAEAQAGQLKHHQTSGGPERSVGRWQRDMNPELQRRSSEIFADVLDELGYSGNAAPGAPAPAAAAPESDPDAESRPAALTGLLRSVDYAGWLHRYTVGGRPSEEQVLAGELGSLLCEPGRHAIPVYMEPDGRIVTESYAAIARRPRKSISWALKPLSWETWGTRKERRRLVAGRLRRLRRRPWRQRRREPAREGAPVGYLYTQPAAGRRALFSAVHPMTGDQLLTTRQGEAESLGYAEAEQLGFIVAAAPVTRRLGTSRLGLPWCEEFGHEVHPEAPAPRRGAPVKRRRPVEPRVRGAFSAPSARQEPRDGLRVSGWALFEEEPVSRVEVLIDGAPVGTARLGIQRLNHRLARNPESIISGFDLRVAPSALPPVGERVTIGARVIGLDGTVSELTLPEPVELLEPDLDESPVLAAARTERFATNGGSNGAGRTRERPLHIAAFAHSFAPGGAQRTLFEQLRRLLETGDYTASVAAPAPGPWQQRFEEIGASVTVTDGFPIAGIADYEDRITELSEWAEAQEADVVIANTLGSFIGVDMASRLGLPSIWIIHESYPLPVWRQMAQRDAPDPYVHGRCIRALAEVDAAIFPAEATRKLFEPYMRTDRVAVAPCGVEFAEIDAHREAVSKAEARQRLGIAPEKRILLSLGIIEPRKGHAVLARAWSRIHAKHPGVELAMVGASDSPYCRGIRGYLEEAELTDSCSLIPATMQPFDWHAAADYFVLASDVESAPVVLAEAMAFETPVVASDVYGIPELLTHGRDGFLCRPMDVGELAGALDDLLRMPPESLRPVAANANRRAREHHDPIRFADTLGRLVDEVAHMRQPAWS